MFHDLRIKNLHELMFHDLRINFHELIFHGLRINFHELIFHGLKKKPLPLKRFLKKLTVQEES